jgi:hypothetical protein
MEGYFKHLFNIFMSHLKTKFHMANVATKSSNSTIDVKKLSCSKETFYAWMQQSSLVVQITCHK